MACEFSRCGPVFHILAMNSVEFGNCYTSISPIPYTRVCRDANGNISGNNSLNYWATSTLTASGSPQVLNGSAGNIVVDVTVSSIPLDYLGHNMVTLQVKCPTLYELGTTNLTSSITFLGIGGGFLPLAYAPNSGSSSTLNIVALTAANSSGVGTWQIGNATLTNSSGVINLTISNAASPTSTSWGSNTQYFQFNEFCLHWITNSN